MKLTTQKLKQLIREELAKMNKEEMVNEIIGPDQNISLRELQSKVHELAGVHQNQWLQKLNRLKYWSAGNMSDELDYLDWKEGLEETGKIKGERFAQQDIGYARKIHKMAIEQLTAEKRKQKELPMSENRRRRIKRK